MKDLKYLVAYAIPASAIIGLSLQGYWSFFTPIFAFILVPLAETLLPQDEQNLTSAEASSKKSNPYFDLLLYLNLPLVFGIAGYYLWSLTKMDFSTPEIIGLTFSVGITMGSNGINVAHELGHRKKAWERFLGKILLLPALYMHFYIEHNFGHHLHAATKIDPASAKYNQSVYSFWLTSILGQYFSAWRIQMDLLRRNGSSFFSRKNDMFWFTLFQASYVFMIAFYLGTFALFIAICLAFTGILLLETINYIEHYGLSRRNLSEHRYERVREVHSWNSNHVLGRMMLYELTRHSDHHHRAHKKYQLLEYHEISPQMPYGYPTSMVLSLIPSLWFSLMNSRIPSEMRP